MYSATVTSKRQITIPVRLFKNKNLKKGDKLNFFEEENRIIIQRDIDIVRELQKMNFSNRKIKTPKNKSVDDIINESTEKHYSDKKWNLKLL